jgi:hypothetical protein
MCLSTKPVGLYDGWLYRVCLTIAYALYGVELYFPLFIECVYFQKVHLLKLNVCIKYNGVI